MALTLAQLAKIETEPLRQYVIVNMLRDAKIMEVLPFANVNSLRSIAVRWRTLPSVAFRKINAGYTPSEGDTEQVWESVFGLGGEIKYDRVFEKVGNTITDMKRLQTDMKIKSLALTFNDYFVNGSHVTDVDGFEGLQKRNASMPSRQLVRFAGTGAASVLDPTSSVANGNHFFDKMEELHYKCNMGQVNAIIGNEGFYYGLGRIARYIQASGGNWLTVSKDSFDRDIVNYKGAPVIDIGFKKDQSTEIIPGTMTADDAGADATQCFFCSFNEQQGITGIQLSTMDVYDPLNGGEQESTPTKLVRIDWWVGLAGFGSYGFTRGWNLENPTAWT